MNATSSILTFSDTSSLFSIVIIVGFMAVILTFFLIAMTSVTRYKKLKGLLLWLFLTFQYFLIGITTLVVLAVPTLILYYFGKQASEGNVVPIWITLSMIAGYFIISFIGWISKRFVVDRIKLFEEELSKEEKEEIQNAKT